MTPEERQEKIETYGRGYALLEAALPEFPPEMWQFKPSPADWSIHEIIIHLADSETNAALRARRLMVEPGQPLMAYDQDLWADELDYHNQDTDEALAVLKGVRSSTYKLLKQQPKAVFEHSAVHPEYDQPYTFDMWLDIYARHIPGHIEQMRANYRQWQAQQG